MATDNIGLYVHIPFCLKKCNYCDFCSFSNLSIDERTQYIKRLLNEIEGYKRKPKISLNSIFFGGGTPSLLAEKDFSLIADKIGEIFEISDDTEFTVEVNPKTVTEDKLLNFKKNGVNRISIGMQSIHENELKKLGRVYSFEDFRGCYNMVINAGITNTSVDVMYGIPEQTLDSFRETLSKVIELSPQHISVYGLILEEGTPFFENVNSLNLPTEDEECDMYYLASQMLRNAGYSHYEISNYAQNGYEARHNLKYWHNKEYIGVGISAYSNFEGYLYGNTKDFNSYIKESGISSEHFELITEKDSMFEYAMLNLRLKNGFSLIEYRNRFGIDFCFGKEDKISSYIEGGFLKIENERIFLTEKGFYVSNTILSQII